MQRLGWAAAAQLLDKARFDGVDLYNTLSGGMCGALRDSCAHAEMFCRSVPPELCFPDERAHSRL